MMLCSVADEPTPLSCLPTVTAGQLEEVEMPMLKRLALKDFLVGPGLARLPLRQLTGLWLHIVGAELGEDVPQGGGPWGRLCRRLAPLSQASRWVVMPSGPLPSPQATGWRWPWFGLCYLASARGYSRAAVGRLRLVARWISLLPWLAPGLRRLQNKARSYTLHHHWLLASIHLP
jgi:hypothetical protein